MQIPWGNADIYRGGNAYTRPGVVQIPATGFMVWMGQMPIVQV